MTNLAYSFLLLNTTENTSRVVTKSRARLSTRTASTAQRHTFVNVRYTDTPCGVSGTRQPAQNHASTMSLRSNELCPLAGLPIAYTFTVGLALQVTHLRYRHATTSGVLTPIYAQRPAQDRRVGIKPLFMSRANRHNSPVILARSERIRRRFSGSGSSCQRSASSCV